jgi:hypothetical protein
MYNTCLAKENPKRTLWGSLARSDYRWYSGNYSTKPPSTNPSKYGSPTAIGGCHMVMWLYWAMMVARYLCYFWWSQWNCWILKYQWEALVIVRSEWYGCGRICTETVGSTYWHDWKGSEAWGVREWTDVPLQDGRMNSRHCWWTHGVALVRLWDSGHGSTRNKWRKNADNFTA